jgi:hypothetical protein
MMAGDMEGRMRWAVIAGMLLLAACSKAEHQDAREEVATTAGRAPNVGVTPIAGLSLSYQYGFRVPIERISSIQEEHASQCEALTPARCRITGMTYQVGRDRTISASLQFKLAPDAARRFGKQGVDTVARRGGMLSYARIDSEESGAVVDAVDRDAAAINAERRDINEQLAKPGLSASERTQLQARLAQLADEQRQSSAMRGQAALKLASTPMTFQYESGDVDPGLTDGPILGAVKDGWANIISGVATILAILITLIPWVVTAGLLVWLWRRFGVRLGLRRVPDQE